MKNKKYINLLNFKRIKQKNYISLKRGDFIQIIYCNLDKGYFNFQNYSGVCLYKTNRGLSSICNIRSLIDGCVVDKIFKLYSPYVLDIKVLKSSKKHALKSSFSLKLKNNKLYKN